MQSCIRALVNSSSLIAQSCLAKQVCLNFKNSVQKGCNGRGKECKLPGLKGSSWHPQSISGYFWFHQDDRHGLLNPLGPPSIPHHPLSSHIQWYTELSHPARLTSPKPLQKCPKPLQTIPGGRPLSQIHLFQTAPSEFTVQLNVSLVRIQFLRQNKQARFNKSWYMGCPIML